MVSGHNLAPIRERCIATLFEVLSSTELAVEIEVIVDDRVRGGEFLQGSRASELLHGSLPSPERLMGVLGPVVQPSCGALPAAEAQNCQGSPARARLGDIDFQHLAFMIDGSPEIASLTIDMDEDLVQVPSPLDVLASSAAASFEALRQRSARTGSTKTRQFHG